ncbi:hypothetical protein [Rhodococcus sp. 15-649-2-2]|uniref:hypothetical protein n=1 Tax=Rhodococcus sp. 15-649-2-2 TaxID=2023140 RepID=UPI0015C66EEF|nr:hypothetical protein [Rhodococcus sp. 15-649-2-2]
MSTLATNGIYLNHRYAVELAASIAAETGDRTRVQQLPGNRRLWEIVWATDGDVR